MKLNIPTKEYHELKSLSNSRLQSYVSYDVWGKRSTNMIAFKYPMPFEQTDPMMVGSIIDEVLTEGASYDESSIAGYAIVARRSGKNDKEINQSQADDIMKRILYVKGVPEIQELIDSSEKQVVLTGEYELETGEIMPVRGKLDFLHTNKSTGEVSIIDMKCASGSIEQFEKSFINPRDLRPSHYAYQIRQLAFYGMLARLNGINVSSFEILCIATDECKWYTIPSDIITLATSLNNIDINELHNNLNILHSIKTTYVNTITKGSTNTNDGAEQATGQPPQAAISFENF